MSVTLVTLVTLVADDGFSVAVETDVARISKLVQTCVEDSGDSEEVPLVKVARRELEHIVQFMRLHAELALPTIPQPLPSSDLTRILPTPYTDFIMPLSDEEVIALINAANYMDIAPLLRLCAARIATFFHGKSREEIIAMLNIVSESTQ